MNRHTLALPSPIGSIAVLASPRGLVACVFGASRERAIAQFAARSDALGDHGKGSEQHLVAARDWLTAYFAGDLDRLRPALDPGGSDFFRSVWQALCAIPAGITRSYGELAALVGRPGAARAIGMANHRNPIGLIVPCHRVIGASGQLTGYAAGLATKAWLLDHERHHAGLTTPTATR